MSMMESSDDSSAPAIASGSWSGAVVIPVAIYVVAALFFAKGLFMLVATATAAVQTSNLTLDVVLSGLIPSLVAPCIMLALGWGLAHFGEGSRTWARFFLLAGILVRLVALALMALYFGDYANGRVSGKNPEKFRRETGSWSSWRVAGIQRVKSSATPKVGWYFVRNGVERKLTPVDTIAMVAILFLGVLLNFWQYRVLRRPQINQLFELGERSHLIGQMSLVRFLLMTTVFFSVHLTTWKADLPTF